MSIAIVTGAGGGIGAACARALAGRHDLVLCVDRDSAAAGHTVHAIRASGAAATAVVADAGAEDFGEQVAAVARDHGPVGAAVHAVAFEEHRPALELTVDSFTSSLRLGPVAAFSLFRALVLAGAACDGAAFTVIGSLHERRPFRNCLGYNAAHGALGQVVRSLAHEWAERRIRVNAVVPGWIRTPGERRLYGDEHLDRASGQLPFGALGTPEQVADAVAFMTSAAYVSGSFLTVDGALDVSLARLPEEVR